MIRPATTDDMTAIIGLAVDAELFSADDADELAELFSGYYGEGHLWLIDEHDGQARGVVYASLAPVTDRTWYVKMLAVRPDNQRQGHGAALMGCVEEELRAMGQRLLLVETSSVPAYANARAFYAKCGCAQEARIRDYYEAGDDMILFHKPLNANSDGQD